jgi:hypothetical protein
MKTKKLFLATIFLLAFYAKAAVITVSNNPNSPGQYTDLQTAIDAAAPNDILYVHGSATDYGNVNINKPLTIIGAGAMPNKGLQLPTSISSINIGYNNAGTVNGSGTSVTGCRISTFTLGAFTTSTNVTLGIANITLRRNRIFSIFNGSGANYNNFVINNNIISSISSAVATFKLSNAIISNNIINSINGITPSIGGNTLVNNNIIISSLTNNQQCIFSNNIFYFPPQNFATNTSNTYTKNMFFAALTEAGPNLIYTQATFETNQNTFSSNLYNQDPLFINANTSVSGLQGYDYAIPVAGPFINYNLAATSPGKKYGTDGTDAGIHGGATPYVQEVLTDSRFRYFPMPAIPQMMEMSILNSAIPQNGTLNVNFTARKND